MQELFHEIMRARQRVYRLARPTPLDTVRLPGGAELFLKREDLSPVHSYKWRGAFNKLSAMRAADREGGVVAASAGNHAQGVALAAQFLDAQAWIYMPRSTPRMKIREVERLGGRNVHIIVQGDMYDDAAALARTNSAETGRPFIHAYDDLLVMGGQGSIGDEVAMAAVDPEVAFLQIGGGGMAASTACVLKTFYPKIRIIGVEGVRQACMRRALEAGRPVDLAEVDVFCDGTAVKRAGDLTYRYCLQLLDEIVTVANDEVCAAIQALWESTRLIAEPSGAMGVAAAMKRPEAWKGRRAVCVLSGANMDFAQLAWIARHAGVGLDERRYYQFEIGERAGSLLDLLETVMDGINIIDFQYGKTDSHRAWPVIGFEASPMALEMLGRRLDETSVAHKDVTLREDVEFRIINYNPALFRLPYFAIVEFPERAGALRDFMRRARDMASICYFNYATTGEQVGRALMGFEFDSEDARQRFLRHLDENGPRRRPLSMEVLSAIL